jgi:hypothetical protein
MLRHGIVPCPAELGGGVGIAEQIHDRTSHRGDIIGEDHPSPNEVL